MVNSKDEREELRINGIKNMKKEKVKLKITNFFKIIILITSFFIVTSIVFNKNEEKVLSTPIISVYDGSVNCVKYAIKDKLKHPSTLKIINSSVLFKVDDQTFVQSVTFKAKNDFGMYMESQYSFIIKGVGEEAYVYDAKENKGVFELGLGITLQSEYYRETGYKTISKN